MELIDGYIIALRVVIDVPSGAQAVIVVQYPEDLWIAVKTALSVKAVSQVTIERVEKFLDTGLLDKSD